MDILELHQPVPDHAELMQRAAAGVPFMLAIDGKPVAQVLPLDVRPETPGSEPKARRQLGGLEGRFEVPDDFDTMFQAEIEEMFYGKSE